MTNKLFLIALIPILLIAPSQVFAILSTNQTTTTTTTTTNKLLQEILNQSKLQVQLQQLNSENIATKLDIIKAQLGRIQTTLSNPVIPATPPPPTLLPPGMVLAPSPFSPNPPPIPINPGCGIGTDNSLCNIPVPPFLSSPPPLNGTTCKEQNDNGVLIECPVFPSGLQPPLPTPPPIPPSTAIPLPPASDCIPTVYGVFLC